jgi:hypothetical protein
VEAGVQIDVAGATIDKGKIPVTIRDQSRIDDDLTIALDVAGQVVDSAPSAEVTSQASDNQPAAIASADPTVTKQSKSNIAFNETVADGAPAGTGLHPSHFPLAHITVLSCP